MFLKKESPWNTNLRRFAKDFTNPVFSQNQIFAEKIALNLDGRKTLRNNNVLVLGQESHLYDYALTNMMQCNGNYIVDDVGGLLHMSLKAFLEENGYQVHTLNLTQPVTNYNPLFYIHTSPDLIAFMEAFEDEHMCNQIAERALMCAIIRYVKAEQTPTMSRVMELLHQYDTPEKLSKMDTLFENADDDVKHYYRVWKMQKPDAMHASLCNILLRYAVFDTLHVQQCTNTSSFNPAKFAEEKQALFIIHPEYDSMYQPLVNVIMQQLFSELYLFERKRLRNAVAVFLRHTIPKLEQIIAICRMCNVRISLLYQSITELRSQSPTEWESIIGGCDSYLYIKSDLSTMEYTAKELGYQPIRMRSKFRKGNPCYCRMQDPLMTPDEIAHMKDYECIAIIRGLKPFRGTRYTNASHPNYKRVLACQNGKSAEIEKIESGE